MATKSVDDEGDDETATYQELAINLNIVIYEGIGKARKQGKAIWNKWVRTADVWYIL